MEYDNLKMFEFKIFIVSIPYKDYWRNARTITVGKDTFEYKFWNLSSNVKYRITIAPVHKWKAFKISWDIDYLGPRTHIMFAGCHSNHITALASLHYKGVVPKPNDFSCVGVTEDSIIISWQKPATSFHIKSYIVEIFAESDGIEQIYSTTKLHLIIQNLTKAIWYGVRVRANNDEIKHLDFRYAGYFVCRTQIKGKK